MNELYHCYSSHSGIGGSIVYMLLVNTTQPPPYNELSQPFLVILPPVTSLETFKKVEKEEKNVYKKVWNSRKI